MKSWEIEGATADFLPSGGWWELVPVLVLLWLRIGGRTWDWRLFGRALLPSPVLGLHCEEWSGRAVGCVSVWLLWVVRGVRRTSGERRKDNEAALMCPNGGLFRHWGGFCRRR